MADVAGVQDPGQEQEPQGGGEPEPQGQPEGSGEQPSGGESPPDGSVPGDGKPASAAPKAEAGATPEGYVPFVRFREARQRGTQIQQAFEQAKAEWEQEKQQLQAQVEEAKTSGQNSQEAQDYRYIQELFRENPDIYQMLQQRVSEGGGPRYTPPGARNGAAKVELPPEMKKWGETLESMKERLERQEQQAQEREKAAFNAQTEQKLTGIVNGFLEKKGYGQEMASLALDYILNKAERDPEWQGMDFEDVPHVLNQWHGMMERAFDARSKPLVNGKQGDRNLPPGPGGSQAPVRGAPSTDDDATRHAMVEGLRGLGWGS